MLLWLPRMLNYQNVLHWLCLDLHMKKEHQIGPKRAPDQIGPPVWTTKRISYNFWFPEDMRAHEYSLESLLSLLSNGSDRVSISVWSRPQSSILYRNVFCPRCCVILFRPKGPCIKLSPLWTRPRVGARPQHPFCRPPKFLYPLATAKNTWVLFSSS